MEKAGMPMKQCPSHLYEPEGHAIFMRPPKPLCRNIFNILPLFRRPQTA